MEEILVKTHLIIKDVHEEYSINWCGKIKDTKPKFKNGKPVFTIRGGGKRIELNTSDMSEVEKWAKKLTNPKGRKAITTDYSHIYIQEENDKETLLGVLTHNHIKTYAPMYDKVGWR